jgi:hypothetical protein
MSARSDRDRFVRAEVITTGSPKPGPVARRSKMSTARLKKCRAQTPQLKPGTSTCLDLINFDCFQTDEATSLRLPRSPPKGALTAAAKFASVMTTSSSSGRTAPSGGARALKAVRIGRAVSASPAAANRMMRTQCPSAATAELMTKLGGAGLADRPHLLAHELLDQLGDERRCGAVAQGGGQPDQYARRQRDRTR